MRGVVGRSQCEALLEGTDVFFNRSIDGGTTWSNGDVRLDTDSPGADFSFGPVLEVEGSSVYVAWTDGRADGPFSTEHSDIYFNRSLDGGATWLASDVRVNTGTAASESAGSHQLAAVGSDVYAVWADARLGFIYFNRSQDGGATWGTQELRLDVAGKADSPAIAATDDAVYVAWMANNGPCSRCRVTLFTRSLDGGVSWSPPMYLDVGTYDPPEIAVNGDAVFVLWGGRDVTFMRSFDRGATWLASPTRLRNPMQPGGSSGPVLAAEGSTVFAAWLDNRDGTWHIYGNVPFGTQPYGAGIPGAGGLVPRLEAQGFAALGQTVTFTLDRFVGSAPAALLIGGPGSRTQVPIFGGTLLVAPTLALPVVLGGTPGAPGAGSATFALPIVDDASLLASSTSKC